MNLKWREVMSKWETTYAQMDGLPGNYMLQITAVPWENSKKKKEHLNMTQYEVVIVKEGDTTRMFSPMADVLFNASDMEQAKLIALKYEAEFLETKAEALRKKIRKRKRASDHVQDAEQEIDRLIVTAACLRACLLEATECD